MNAYISNIYTANPETRISQKEIAGFMNNIYQFRNGEKVRLDALYRASGIKYRYSVLKDFIREKDHFTFFPNATGSVSFPSTQSRMEVYQKEAIKIASQAGNKCLDSILDSREEITHLITTSCTGFYAPGIDIDLIHSLGLSHNVHRTAINYMGCYAAISALKNAASIAKSDPKAKVLVVSVELCSIHFQDRVNDDFLLANALFGDGAAALVVSGEQLKKSDFSISATNFHCNILPDGKKDMAWSIGNLGFEMKLSTYVPDIIKSDIGKMVDSISDENEIQREDLVYYAIHPGGKKILKVIEDELNITQEENRFAHHVLANYGNMSSPTVLYVLKEIFDQLSPADHGKKILSLAFGPGLTVESALLDIEFHAH